MSQTFIQPNPPRDCDKFKCRCARCGSTLIWETCEVCGGDGVDGHDCGEDCCCCLYPEDNVRCDGCRGHGGHHVCLSDYDYCRAHPLEGRENIESHTPEWFRID